jgi:hypothetical protein
MSKSKTKVVQSTMFDNEVVPVKIVHKEDNKKSSKKTVAYNTEPPTIEEFRNYIANIRNNQI